MDPLTQFLLGLPLFSAGLLALIPFASPTWRWSRRLKRDLDLLAGMPEGVEKARLRRLIHRETGDLLDYRTLLSRADKVAPWAVVVTYLAVVGSSFVTSYNPFALEVPGDWAIYIVAG